MVFKKIFLLIFTIFIINVSTNASERIKSLPLKELQNPNGPSYVPIPYPQNEGEIITDLKYFMNRWILKNKQEKMSGIPNSASDLERICFNFLSNQGIMVGEIVKVKNRIKSREKEYSFLIRLKNNKNYDVARFGMLASGVLARWCNVNLKRLSSESPGLNEMSFKPLLDKSMLHEQIKSMTGYNLDEDEIGNVSLVEGQSLVGDLLNPAIEINLKDGRTLFKSEDLNAVFIVEDKINCERDDYRRKMATILSDSMHRYLYFNQSAEGEYLILKKMENKSE